MLEAATALGSVFLDPYLLFLIFATTIIGIVIGVLPGLGATTGAALLLPFTLTMEPVHAIAVLATIYVSATFAGRGPRELRELRACGRLGSALGWLSATLAQKACAPANTPVHFRSVAQTLRIRSSPLHTCSKTARVGRLLYKALNTMVFV